MAAVAIVAAFAAGAGVQSEGYASSLNQNVSSGAVLMAQNDVPAMTQGFVVAPKAAPAPKGAPKPAAPGVAPPTSAVDTANTVNKLLAPRPSDPNVPLPQEDLAQVPSENGPLTGPRFYGRNESQNGVLGGVFGLRIPIPATGGLSHGSTTSGGGGTP
ncbi:MAG: hypothetical protein JOY81_10605 [Alphaproteobacteria bacterium]|nr:hypothetical protein [Alphaproteobacteria bacterium]